MNHCQEPDDAGTCTHCGKCGKGMEEQWRTGAPENKAFDNHLTPRDALLFDAFALRTRGAGKRLLVLNHTLYPIPSEPVDGSGHMERRDSD